MPDADVASTLNELERKLRELEDELKAPTPSPPTRNGSAPRPAAGPALTPEPSRPAEASAQEQLDELLRFRNDLERSAQELMSEYERLLGSLRATGPTSGGPDPAPSSPPIAPKAAAPAPWQPAPSPIGDLDEAVMDGAITIDAGPFTDITLLSGFEQALGGVPGVRDVYVRGFEGSRAMIDVTLGQPVALGTALRRFSPVAFMITAADAGHLSVAIQGV